MQVTDVHVYLRGEERLKAYATITFDNCFVVRDLRIIDGNNGLFIAMPSKRLKSGVFKDLAHPLNNETRKMIEEAVLHKYEAEVSKIQGEPSAD
jgi:stage V sporulation protein G